MKPLGRDRLGRLVYVGDRVFINSVHAAVIERTEGWPPSGFRCVFEYDGNVYEGVSATDAALVDLETSPKRTNYERYFADIGSQETIDQAVDQICDSQGTDCSDTCPFWNWEYDADVGECYCIEAFKEWLEQEATV